MAKSRQTFRRGGTPRPGRKVVTLKKGATVTVGGEKARLLTLVRIHDDGSQRWVVKFDGDPPGVIAVRTVTG